eukprot:SAG31_NODE_1862_length_7044_cov_11.784017_7_plen_147_part_01
MDGPDVATSASVCAGGDGNVAPLGLGRSAGSSFRRDSEDVSAGGIVGGTVLFLPLEAAFGTAGGPRLPPLCLPPDAAFGIAGGTPPFLLPVGAFGIAGWAVPSLVLLPSRFAGGIVGGAVLFLPPEAAFGTAETLVLHTAAKNGDCE